jgi:uncharacterized UBP type Zn finger protein
VDLAAPPVPPAADASGAEEKLPPLCDLAEYCVRGVVCHRGATPFSGHYVAHVCAPLARDVERHGAAGMRGWQWWRCDDSEVTPLAAADVAREGGQHGYIIVLVAA